ncbi:NAD(+) diphosphatase [Microbacterium sp.]|uniref:NAD(+) diphosphatase n=1 Tax=Microbacterium sp. TaxID=51671 RepID=UPI003A8584E1
MSTNESTLPSEWTDFDRGDAERGTDDLLERLRADPRTRAIVVREDRTPQLVEGRLRSVPVTEVTGSADWAFLGRTREGTAVLVAALTEPASGDESWPLLRVAGGTLPAHDLGVIVTAVSLGRWLRDAPFCSACGARATLTQAGWARRCPSCGREHFPRTDPAVIVAVTSAGGQRLLLGHNAAWGDRPMYSAFAGFVEAGESLEATIVREVEEEAGVVVTDLEYRGSQAWPYPRSLMLGFRARATNEADARPDGEEIVDMRWFDRDAVREAFAGRGDVQLPGAASIAHALIRDWMVDG